MATNDFIGFASRGSANVMSQADYAAAREQLVGVQPGMASSAMANKVWRQGANMAAVIGELIKNHGIDALDNGDLATLYNALLSATASATLAGLMSAEDKAVLDSVPTTYLPLSGGVISNSVDSNILCPGLVEISSSTPFIDFHHANSSTDYSARIINNADGQLQLSISNDASVLPKSLTLKSDGTLTWNGKDVAIAETGTWTPVLSGGSTAGSFTYDANTVGYYVKIDKLVYFLCRVVTTDYSVHPTGRVRVTGLPYTSANHNASYSYVNALGYAGGVNSSVMKICGGFVAFNTAYIDLIVQSSDTPWQKNYGAFSSSSSTGYNIQFNSSNKTANLYAAGCYECA